MSKVDNEGFLGHSGQSSSLEEIDAIVSAETSTTALKQSRGHSTFTHSSALPQLNCLVLVDRSLSLRRRESR